MNKKNPQKEEQINIDGRAAIAVVATLAVLVMCLIVMFVGVALDASDNGGAIMSSGGGGGGGKNNSVQAGNQVPSSAPSAKTGMQLPSTTPKGTYLSSGNGTEIENGLILSEHAILVRLDTGAVVASKAPDVQVHPASMTKMMTLLVACENLKDPTKLLTVTQDMIDKRDALDPRASGELVKNTSVVNADGNVEKIDIVGKSVTVEDLLHLINYQSDTIACLLVADEIAGSEKAFVELMNKKAAEIGLTQTTFVNCTGLTEKDGSYNLTTAREMAAIMACAMKNEVAKNITTAYKEYKKYNADIYEDGKKTEYSVPFNVDWYVRNTRLNNNPWAGVTKILGAKSGYEDECGACFVTYAVNDDTGTEYVCVTIGKVQSSKVYVDNAKSTADTRAIYKKYVTE